MYICSKMGVYYFKFHRNKPIKNKDITQKSFTLLKYEQRQLFAKKISKTNLNSLTKKTRIDYNKQS